MILGIDSSSVAGNKKIDWVQAKAQGPLSFALLRSNYGTMSDPQFSKEWPRIKNAGIVRGAYMFLQFPRKGRVKCASPQDQAQTMVDALKDAQEEFDLPPVLDVEFPGDGRIETGMSPDECFNWVDAAYAVLEQIAPNVMIYTSARVWRDDLKNIEPSSPILESPLWLARYFFKAGPARREGMFGQPPPVPQIKGRNGLIWWGDEDNWWIHQFQGDAVDFPGFSGKVDLNKFNPLTLGARGARVQWVARRLGRTGSAFTIDLVDAVRQFQTTNKLLADGVVGPRTFARLAACSVPTT